LTARSRRFAGLTGKQPRRLHRAVVGTEPAHDRFAVVARIQYEGSMMEDDFHPFYLRKGDSWTKIDYGKTAATG